MQLATSSQAASRAATRRGCALPAAQCRPLVRPQRLIAAQAEPDMTDILENPDSDSARKKAKADQLRAAEKFMVIGSGTATCKGCGYEYTPEKGDPDFPVPRGIKFESLPDDYNCPICGAPKDKFESRVKVVAGFAENQRYGLGTNSMTGEQKSLLIYGALGIFFLLFLGGYALE